MSSNDTIYQKIDELFPAPSLPPSPLSPQRLPGADLESLTALQDVLKDNHQRHHIFFNDLHFHNHATHRALAIYALGGRATIIRDYYERDSLIQLPVVQPPEPITEENFVDHLGEEIFYSGYVDFFTKQVLEKGAASTIEEFVFSEKYNFQKGREANTQPEMLARFSAGLLHPLIHSGHGFEFGLKGMLVEGLALTAVHNMERRGVLAPCLFATKAVEYTGNAQSTLALNAGITDASTVSKTGGVHAFDIIARILTDDRFNRKLPAKINKQFWEFFAEQSFVVKEHVEQWTVNLSLPGEIENKMEEIVWLSSLIYGAGGLTASGFQAEFFLMHLVTSSIFLPSFIAYLSPRSQVLLLRGYLQTALTWWVMRGRPSLNIKSFMTTTTLEPSITTTPTPKTALTTETTPTPNPFLPILQSAITHPNEHLIKIQRAFAHFNALYGTRPAGFFKGTGLKDAEMLDGSLFLRASLLTADYVGWVREGKEETSFSFRGFF